MGDYLKAAYIERVGPVEVIEVGEQMLPSPQENEVVIRALATTVNVIDCYIRSGKYPQDLPKPFIIGRDICGEVIETGARVTRFKKGQKVWSNYMGFNGRQGTFAECLVVNQDTLYPLPEGVDPQKAVVTLHSALTAYIGLYREAEISSNNTLLINGAAGNVGSCVLQMAKAAGLTVCAGTSTKEKIKYCRILGADYVFNYIDKNVFADLRDRFRNGFDVVWNTSLNHDFKLLLPLIAHRGTYILMSGLGKEALLPVGDLYTRDASIKGFAITNATKAEYDQAANVINSLLLADKLEVRIADKLSLDQAREAHRQVEQGGLWGKLLITI
jgi:NADPH2:quinone reductase